MNQEIILPVAETRFSDARVSLFFFSAGHSDHAHVECPHVSGHFSQLVELLGQLSCWLTSGPLKPAIPIKLDFAKTV